MKINPLTLDFLTQKPGTAASVLQNLDAEKAAIYLSNKIPIRVVAPVIERIESWPAARILEHMSLEKNCAVLNLLKFPAAAAIMRLFEEQKRQQILAQLPTQLVKALKRSLSYPQDTVGAWMDHSALHFSEELTIANCLSLLKKAQRSFDLIVVVDNKHRIAGVVPPGDLLIRSAQCTLKEIARPGHVALAANASLVSAKGAPWWRHYIALPVRDGNDVFVGTINRESLLDAMVVAKPKRKITVDDTVLVHLGGAMVTAASGLLTMSTSGVLADTELGENNDDRSR